MLKQKAAVYVNSDSNQRGFLHVGGSHTLEKFANELARDVIDPEKHISVSERMRAERLVKAPPAERHEISGRADLRIDALGSGSDYTPFLQHIGIASLNFGYGGEGNGGSYHSVYDSFDHFTRFCDPDFDYGIALAKTTGRAILRLANADTLPFETSAFADTVEKYSGELSKLADDLREETKQMNRLIHDKIFDATADPRQTYVAPEPKADVPFLNFAPLQNAVAGLKESSGKFESARHNAFAKTSAISEKDQQALDSLLMNLEQTLTSIDGLPRRPWYRHLIYAPGFYTGYGVKTLPGVREAIEQRDWPEATRQIERVAKALDRFSDDLDHAATVLEHW
jgi:N-acetylated-alpha-linked acidic dipeptidase